MSQLDKSAHRLLSELARSDPRPQSRQPTGTAVSALLAADLAVLAEDRTLRITPAGRAHLARERLSREGSPIDPFLGQHLDVASVQADRHAPSCAATDLSESPLVWLARRKARDGRPLIASHQLQAGERLRGEFTRAQMMPRTTAAWDVVSTRDRRSGEAGAHFSDSAVAARQRLRQALDAVGPEFAGLLLDVCCFLKGLEEVERERQWPPRSAKLVLQLGLDRLARHYGYAAQARGAAGAQLQTWLAPGAAFTVGE